MPNSHIQGPQTSYEQLGSIRLPIYGIARHSFVNRTPLFSRLPEAPVGAMSFKTSTTLFRPRSNALNNGGTVGAGDATITMTDASIYQTGDVIEIQNEQLLVTAVNTATEVLTVTRGYAGTTAATHADALAVYILGNSRTGAEVNVDGIAYVPTVLTQYLQTFQHPYQVGGALASSTEYALPPGVTSVVGKQRMSAMQNCADDVEVSMYRGRPVGETSATARQQAAGLRNLIVTNNTASPTNGSAYKASDLIRDTVKACFDNGGNPTVLLMSTDWMGGLTTWGQAMVRIQAGSTELGVKIDTFTAPFLNDLEIIPCPLMRQGQVACLSGDEIRMRVKRAMYDKPRGSRGDAEEGDILMESALELDNEAHHAWVEGITGFAAG